MSVRSWKQLAVIFGRLSPGSVQREADRSFSLALVGAEQELRCWRDRLVPAGLSERKRDQGLKRLFTIPLPLSPAYAGMLAKFDVCWITQAAADSVRSITRNYVLLPPPAADGGDETETPAWAAAVMGEVREKHPDLRLPLARHYWPLRGAAVGQFISTIALENAAFAILSALPDVIPSPIELPWAIAEFASDTVVITANQLRMAFLIAAASDSPVGWQEQKGQLASIAGSAFGWRALARELAGKMPGGAGLLAKGLIAYAATHVGRGLAQFHRIGRHFTRSEKHRAYQEAYRGGRALVEDLARRMAGRRRDPGPITAPEAASGAWLPEAE